MDPKGSSKFLTPKVVNTLREIRGRFINLFWRFNTQFVGSSTTLQNVYESEFGKLTPATPKVTPKKSPLKSILKSSGWKSKSAHTTPQKVKPQPKSASLHTTPQKMFQPSTASSMKPFKLQSPSTSMKVKQPYTLSTQDISAATSAFTSPGTPGTALTQQQNLFKSMLLNKYNQGTPASNLFDLSSLKSYGTAASQISHGNLSTGSAATGITKFSTMVHHSMPLDNISVIRLKTIKENMGKKSDLYDDKQLFGLDMNEFKIRANVASPIESTFGVKNDVGKYIKTSHNTKAKSFHFSIRKKASDGNVRSLISYMQKKLPAFRHLKVFVKRGKMFSEMNISNYDELFVLLRRLKKKRRMHQIKLSW